MMLEGTILAAAVVLGAANHGYNLFVDRRDRRRAVMLRLERYTALRSSPAVKAVL